MLLYHSFSKCQHVNSLLHDIRRYHYRDLACSLALRGAMLTKIINMSEFYSIVPGKGFANLYSNRIVLAVEDIYSLAADQQYTMAYDVSGKQYDTSHYLCDTMRLLAYDFLIRSHKSVSFNIQYAVRVVTLRTEKCRHAILLSNDVYVRCARDFKEIAMELIDYYKIHQQLPPVVKDDIGRILCITKPPTGTTGIQPGFAIP